MEILGSLVRNLVVIIFVHTLLEMLLPQGRFYRYIRLVTGLMVILMVVNALGTFLNRIQAGGAHEFVAAAPGDLHAGERVEQLRRLSREQSLSVYRAALLEVVREEVEAPGIWTLVAAGFTLEENPEAEDFGAIRRLEVKVREAGVDSGGVEPVRIDPVDADRVENDIVHAVDGEPPRLPDLELALSRRLHLAREIVTVSK